MWPDHRHRQPLPVNDNFFRLWYRHLTCWLCSGMYGNMLRKNSGSKVWSLYLFIFNHFLLPSNFIPRWLSLRTTLIISTTGQVSSLTRNRVPRWGFCKGSYNENVRLLANLYLSHLSCGERTSCRLQVTLGVCASKELRPHRMHPWIQAMAIWGIVGITSTTEEKNEGVKFLRKLWCCVGGEA